MYYTGILLYYSKVKQKLNSFRKRGFVVNLMSKTEFPLVPATARVRLVYFLKFRKLWKLDLLCGLRSLPENLCYDLPSNINSSETTSFEKSNI